MSPLLGGRALRAEWTKLRSVPSTGWTVLALLVLTTATGALVAWDLMGDKPSRSLADSVPVAAGE